MPPKGKGTRQPARPAARYRRGKGAAQVESDSDSDDAQSPHAEQGDHHDEEEETPVLSRAKEERAKMRIGLRAVEVDEKGAVKVDGRAESGRTARELERDSAEEQSDSEDEEDVKPTNRTAASRTIAPPGSDEGSSEYETDSEEEVIAPIYKPVFVSKRNRDTISERAKELDPEALEAKRELEALERKKQSHDLVADSILREMATQDVAEVFPDVDDTDGLDAQAEFEKWKLRELMRIKRDTEAMYAREKLREEVEARRAMPEGLRMKEDTDRAKKTRDDKKKGSQVFLQKYHHKGAFYTDEAILKKHDFTEATTSTNRNIESLPAIMQVRRFGLASQSKYTHLAKEDTSSAGGAGFGAAGRFGAGRGAGGGTGEGCFACGGPHLKRDCPQANEAGPSGSNNGGNFSNRDPTAPRDSGWGARPPPSSRREDDAGRRDDSRGGGGREDYGRRDDRDRYADSGRSRDDDRYGGGRGGEEDTSRDADREGADESWSRGGEKQRDRYERSSNRERDGDTRQSEGGERRDERRRSRSRERR